MEIDFTGERIVPGAANCEPTFAKKMYQEHVARYAFAAQFIEGKDVLDLACGVGYGSQWLGKAGAKSVLGIDIAEDAIEHAKKNYFHPSVSYRVQDARWMDFDRKFDVVTCFEFIEHVDEQVKVLDAIKRALRPDGTLIISTPRPLNDKRTHFHVHELEFEELRRMLSERFPRVQFLFERNCFTSFVGSELPNHLDGLVTVTDKINLEDADYFIFVADLSKDATKETKPVLVVNDDSYVLTLEQDIVNFRNGETYHNNLISELLQKSEGLGAEVSKLQSDVEEQRQRADTLVRMQDQLSVLSGEIASMRDQVRISEQLVPLQHELEALKRSQEASVLLNDRLSQEAEKLGKDHERLSQEAEQLGKENERLSQEAEQLGKENERLSKEAEQLVEENERLSKEAEQLGEDNNRLSEEAEQLVEDNDRLSTENHRIRTALAGVSQQLAETQTRLNAKLAEEGLVEGLRREMAIAHEQHTQEVSLLRQQYEQSERTLNRFRKSVSWKVTRPIRWTGRQYRKITGGTV